MPPTMRGVGRRSSRRGLLTAIGVGAALGLVGLFVGTALFDLGDQTPTTPRTADAPAAAVDATSPTLPPAEVPAVAAEITPTPPEPTAAPPEPTAKPPVVTPQPVPPTTAPAVPTAAPVEEAPVAIAVKEVPDEATSAVTPEPTAALVFERLDRNEVLTPRDLEAIEPATDGRVNRLNTWICEGDVQVEGPSSSAWEIQRVDFLILGDKERLVIHLQRTGPGDGQPVTLTAQRFHTDFIRRFAPRAARPASGRFTVGLLLTRGVKDEVNLRSYRPSGMRVVKEVSSYKAPGPSTRIVTTVGGEGCFRLTVPAWTGPDAENVKKARIFLDVRR